MHIIAILTSIAILIYWVGRAAGGFDKIFGAGQTVANMPRKRRYIKEANKRGYNLIQSPIEAATVLMLSIARMSDDRIVSDAAQSDIQYQLTQEMHLDDDEADGVIRQMRALTHDIVLPESSLFPMVDILRGSIDREDAKRLVDMMQSVARASGPEINTEQTEFIRRFKERMNLL